jgi:hypothetical protein
MGTRENRFEEGRDDGPGLARANTHTDTRGQVRVEQRRQAHEGEASTFVRTVQ